MARNWLRLVLASAIASAFAATPVAVELAHAQTATPPPASKKKGKKAEAADDSADAAKKKQDPAEAQKAIEAAQKLLAAGKAEAAVQSLTTTLSAGHLPPGLMARALLYRGIGYRETQKPAQAIADLTQSLWLKGGLSDTDRGEALRQRSGAYADAGLSDPGTAVTANSGTAKPAASPPASNSWNLFGGLFGSEPAATPEPPPPVAKVPPPSTASIASQPAWSSTTEVRATPVAAPSPAAVAPPAPAVTERPEGRFRVQLGLVRTEGEADAIMGRVRRDLAPVFQAREPEVDQAVVGNFGAMYRVRVGPYASAGEGQAVCTRLKGSGLDCLVVTQ